MPEPIAPVPGWDGFQDPNYTPVPDDFFDVLLAHLTDVEVRVLLYIIRRTYGFKKATDDISLSQIVKGITTRDGRRLDYGAGVSKAGAVLAVKRLETRGILFAQRNDSPERGHEATTYRLRKAGAGLAPEQTRLAHIIDKGSPAPTQGLVHVRDQQEPVVQDTEDKNGSGENAQAAFASQIRLLAQARAWPRPTRGEIAALARLTLDAPAVQAAARALDARSLAEVHYWFATGQATSAGAALAEVARRLEGA